MLGKFYSQRDAVTGFPFGNRAISILDGMRNSDFTVQVVRAIDDNLGPKTLSMLDQVV
jgi:hypothetical protein